MITAAIAVAEPGVLATSGFNDQAGINSNLIVNSPFTIGATIHGQGLGEAGWDGPWERLGGFEDRAPISTEFVFEGDASTKLFADQTFGTSIERPWFEIVPVVRIDAYILVRPAASVRGNAVFTNPGSEIPGKTVAYWEVTNSGAIRVGTTSSEQTADTGFSTLPNVWNKYSLILDAPAQRWSFAFNDRIANLPLTFLIPSNYVDRVNVVAQGSLNSYVDNIVVTSVNGDFDENNYLDGTDFLSWQRGFGIPGGATRSQGDADGDGAVGASDFVVWQTQFGEVLTGTTAVPEPASGAILIPAIAAIRIASKRHCRRNQDTLTR